MAAEAPLLVVAEPPPVPKKHSKKTLNIKTFISGGLAGCMAKTLVAPIDRVKILLQVHNPHYKGAGVFNIFYRIVKEEGFASFYKGNAAQMIRIFPYAAMQYTSYEAYKRLNRTLFPGDKADFILNTLACGSAAGITAVTCTYPLDVIRSRLAFQYKGDHKYAGIRDCIRQIYQESNSVRSFYRGYSITVLGMIPYAGLSFSSFEHIKKFLIKNQIKYLTTRSEHFHIDKDHVEHKHGQGKPLGMHCYAELTVPGKLICGACTGVVAQTITYPIDVIRRHMQLDTMFKDAVERRKMGMYQTLQFVYNKYGITNGLYRGITLNYIRAVPMVSTSFCFYELSKKFLGLQTGELVKLG